MNDNKLYSYSHDNKQIHLIVCLHNVCLNKIQKELLNILMLHNISILTLELCSTLVNRIILNAATSTYQQYINHTSNYKTVFHIFIYILNREYNISF